MTPTPDSLAAIDEARSLLRQTRDALGAVRSQAPGLTAAMAWRSRAAKEFTEGLLEWRRCLDRLDVEIETWDGVLVQRRSQVASAQNGFAG